MKKGKKTDRKLEDFEVGDKVVVKFIDTENDMIAFYDKIGTISQIFNEQDDDFPITVDFEFCGEDGNDYDFYKPHQLELVEEEVIEEKVENELKFKVGDKVKYIKASILDNNEDRKFLNQVGEIIRVLDKSYSYPYRVEFNNDNNQKYGIYLKKSSLELVQNVQPQPILEFKDNFIDMKKFPKPTVVFRIDLNGDVYKIPVDERYDYDEWSEKAIDALLDDMIEDYIKYVNDIKEKYSKYIIKKIGEDLNVR